MACADIGAECGYLTSVLAELVDCEGCVYSIENNPERFAFLERNILDNEYNWVIYKPNLDEMDIPKSDFLHISSESVLTDIFFKLASLVGSSPHISLICHINPESRPEKPVDFDNFFEALHNMGFEGYLFPSFNSLESKEQLLTNHSIKSNIALPRHTFFNCKGQRMIDKSLYRQTCARFFQYMKRARRIYLGDHTLLGGNVIGQQILTDARHAPSIKAFFTPHPIESSVMALLFHMVKGGMVCADIGAGCGYHSVYLASLAGPHGKIYSFEGIPERFNLLIKNTLMNEPQHYRLYQPHTCRWC